MNERSRPRDEVPEHSPFLEQFDAAYRDDPSEIFPYGTISLVVVLVLVAIGAAWVVFVRDDGGAPKTAAVWLQEGLDAHVAGDLEAALDAYGEVLSVEPGNVFANYNVGLISYRNGDLPTAERSYLAALRTDPTYTPALFNLAVLEFESGRFDQAVSHYRELLALDPQDAKAHLNLGFALRAIGDEVKGDAEIARAIELDPSLAGSTGSEPGSSTSTG